MEEGVKGLWGDGPWFSGNPLSEEFESSVSDAVCLSVVSHEGGVWGWHVLGGEAETRALFDLLIRLSTAFLFVLVTGGESHTIMIVSITLPCKLINFYMKALDSTFDVCGEAREILHTTTRYSQLFCQT